MSDFQKLQEAAHYAVEMQVRISRKLNNPTMAGIHLKPDGFYVFIACGMYEQHDLVPYEDMELHSGGNLLKNVLYRLANRMLQDGHRQMELPTEEPR